MEAFSFDKISERWFQSHSDRFILPETNDFLFQSIFVFLAELVYFWQQSLDLFDHIVSILKFKALILIEEFLPDIVEYDLLPAVVVVVSPHGDAENDVEEHVSLGPVQGAEEAGWPGTGGHGGVHCLASRYSNLAVLGLGHGALHLDLAGQVVQRLGRDKLIGLVEAGQRLADFIPHGDTGDTRCRYMESHWFLHHFNTC